MFEVKNEGQRATVYIYGTIGDDWWCPEDANRAKDFSQTLDELSPKPLDIRIDSCGGDVYEGASPSPGPSPATRGRPSRTSTASPRRPRATSPSWPTACR